MGTSVLALDLATSTGWAISDSKGKIVESGTWVLKGEDHQKLAMLASNLRYLGECDCVAIESPFQRGKNARFLIRLGGVAAAYAGTIGAEFYEYAPASVKLAVTGSGSASKRTVYKMVERLTGIKAATDDESDAIAVALCHLNRAKRGKR